MVKSKPKFSNNFFGVVPLIGAGVSVLLSILFAALGAVCISNEYIELLISEYLVMIGQFVSAFVGAWVTTKMRDNDNKILSCCLTAAIYYAVFVCIGMLFFDGLTMLALYGLLSCSAGCLLAIFLCFRVKSSTVKNRRRRRSR